MKLDILVMNWSSYWVIGVYLGGCATQKIGFLHCFTALLLFYSFSGSVLGSGAVWRVSGFV